MFDSVELCLIIPNTNLWTDCVLMKRGGHTNVKGAQHYPSRGQVFTSMHKVWVNLMVYANTGENHRVSNPVFKVTRKVYCNYLKWRFKKLLPGQRCLPESNCSIIILKFLTALCILNISNQDDDAHKEMFEGFSLRFGVFDQ